MIAPMTKYTFVLHHADYGDFLRRLQELGLVDITLSHWEPSDEQRKMVSAIGQMRQAYDRLKELAAREKKASEERPEEVDGHVEPYANAQETLERYQTAVKETERISGLIVKTRTEIEALRPWGAFDQSLVDKLRAQGIELRFFVASSRDFKDKGAEWAAAYPLETVAEEEGRVYLVMALPSGSGPVEADGLHGVKAPAGDYLSREAELKRLEGELEKQHGILLRCAAGREMLREAEKSLKDDLQLSRALDGGGERRAEGSVVVLEGWVPTEAEAKVEAFIGDQNVVSVKDRPKPEDNPPVLLKNKKYPRLFEVIGNFYSLPKYGTMDLTPYFAPFYMIFFGFCLGDGGYGLLFVLAGLFMVLRMKGQMKQIGKLTIWCGAATMLFGTLTGNYFGVQLGNFEAFSRFRDHFLTFDNLFTLAIALGFVHLLFAMLLKVVKTTRLFGFRYALSTVGWMIVIVASLAAFLLPDVGVTGFQLGSPAYWAVAGIGLFMMLFLNSPGKNPFVNLGSGLWNTYNDVTGLMGDVLSYIRLFALGLSGGILALVFNDLALGLSPDIPVVKQLVMVVILIVGHGINIFMSSLSSFVHPMRLTFVEFYKNAGFEASQRAYEPLRKQAANK